MKKEDMKVALAFSFGVVFGGTLVYVQVLTGAAHSTSVHLIERGLSKTEINVSSVSRGNTLENSPNPEEILKETSTEKQTSTTSTPEIISQNIIDIITENCKKLQQNPEYSEQRLYKTSWYNPKNNIAFALPPKCGSTSLRLIEMADSGFIVPSKFPEISKTDPDTIWPVQFVKHGLKKVDEFEGDKSKLLMYTGIRDPINRLISAYKDKIGRTKLSDQSRQYFWNIYSRHITRHYRTHRPVTPNERTAKTQGLIPTFGEFVDFVIDWKLGKLPSFFELRPGDCDGHWCPQTETVPFCQNKFGAIAQVEKFPEDLDPVLESLDLEEIKFEKSGLSNSHFTSKSKRDSEFLAELREDQIQKLKEIYKLDYVLFNGIYSFPTV